MKIAILETGSPSKTLVERHGGYAHMFQQAFDEAGCDISFNHYRVFENNVFPALGAYDGYIISGSPFGVYEDHDFIAPLTDYIKIALEADIPIVGICFGHQLMARAFGARVEKSENGWGVGVHHYKTSMPIDKMPQWVQKSKWIQQAAKAGDKMGAMSCVVSHQDQVLETPENAECLAGSDFCPNGVLLYKNGMGVSFQMHPEFTHDFSRDLLNSRKDRILADVVEVAQKSLEGASDRQNMILLLADFFHYHINRKKSGIQSNGDNINALSKDHSATTNIDTNTGTRQIEQEKQYV